MNLVIYSVLNLAHGAGGEKWIAEVSSRLSRKGHQVTIITTKYGNVSDPDIKNRLIKFGIRVIEIDNYNKLFKIPKVNHFRYFLELLRNNEVLYFNNAFALNELFIYIMKRIAGIAVISGYHGNFPESGGVLRQIYHRYFNRIVSEHFETHHALNKERGLILRSWGYKNVICVPNGVDTLLYHPRQKESIFTVIFAGNMNHQKGIDRFATVVETINKSPDLLEAIHFQIYGIGELSYIPKTLEMKFSNVKYFGFGSEEQLRESYAKSHVFLSPSRFDEFPLSPLEAQASGTPVIGTRIPGMTEIVTDKLTGFLVDSENTAEIVQRILQLKQLWYEKTEEYHKFSCYAREMAFRFDWNIIADKIAEIFIALPMAQKRVV